MKRFFYWLVFFPLQSFILLVIALGDSLHYLFTRFQTEGRELPELDPEEPCSIVILNWNGRHLLEECLPAVTKAVRRTGIRHQILVVDNGSDDDSVEWTQLTYPEVDLLALPNNLGFVDGNNEGVRAAKHDLVVLLNNDMVVGEQFLLPLLEGLAQPGVFAVASQIYFPEGKRRQETGNTHGRFKLGYLHLSHEPVKAYHYSRKHLPVLWAGGGSMAFRRDQFLELGEFSPIFSPCYFEDTDLSYRAWRRGWKVLFAPESRVLHKHRSSTSVRFSQGELERLVEKRRLWYTWKNLQFQTLIPFFLMFPLNLGKWVSVPAYLGAITRLPRVLVARWREPRRRLSDKRLWEWVDSPLSYLNDTDTDRFNQPKNNGKPLKVLVSSAYLPHLGTHGGAGRVFQLLRRAAGKHDMSLITYVEDERDRSYEGQPREYCERVETVLRRASSPLSYFPYEPFEEFNCEEFKERITDLLTEEDFDLVHFEWTQMALHAHLLPHTPKVMTEIEVNYAAHRTLLSVESNPFKKLKLYYNMLQTLYRELEMCTRVDAVVCVTDEDKEYLNGYVPSEKLHVINTGVDTGYFEFDLSKIDRNAIVFVGAFRHYPNIDAMHHFTEEVLPLILEELPQTQLYIVGSGPPKEIKRLGQHPNVTVTGYVDDIRDYYRKAQVVVVPLRTGVGIRGKILEGWSIGRATVATPLACQGLRAIHGENIMIAEDASSFAAWTISLLRNPKFCQRLAVNARKTVEEYYDWDNLAKQVVDLYENLALDPSGGPRAVNEHNDKRSANLEN